MAVLGWLALVGLALRQVAEPAWLPPAVQVMALRAAPDWKPEVAGAAAVMLASAWLPKEGTATTAPGVPESLVSAAWVVAAATLAALGSLAFKVSVRTARLKGWREYSTVMSRCRAASQKAAARSRLIIR